MFLLTSRAKDPVRLLRLVVGHSVFSVISLCLVVYTSLKKKTSIYSFMDLLICLFNVHPSTCVEVKGQLYRVSSSLPPGHASQGWNSGCSGWWQVPSPAGPFYWFLRLEFCSKQKHRLPASGHSLLFHDPRVNRLIWPLEIGAKYSPMPVFLEEVKWGPGASDVLLWVLARTRHPCAIPQPTPLRVGCPRSGSVCNYTLCKALASAPNLTPVSAKSARKD